MKEFDELGYQRQIRRLRHISVNILREEMMRQEFQRRIIDAGKRPSKSNFKRREIWTSFVPVTAIAAEGEPVTIVAAGCDSFPVVISTHP